MFTSRRSLASRGGGGGGRGCGIFCHVVVLKSPCKHSLLYRILDVRFLWKLLKSWNVIKWVNSKRLWRTYEYVQGSRHAGSPMQCCVVGHMSRGGVVFRQRLSNVSTIWMSFVKWMARVVGQPYGSGIIFRDDRAIKLDEFGHVWLFLRSRHVEKLWIHLTFEH